MGRWRAAPEGLVLPIHGEVARSAGGSGPPHSWGGGAQRRRGLVLPIHGEVARSAGGSGPPHSWGGGAQRRRGWSSPFMGRWRAAPEGLVLPIHGEVARSAGGAGPPHSWGGGAQRRRGWSSPFMGRWRAAPEGLVLPIHGEVARSAGGAERGALAPLEQGDRLDVIGLRKHVHNRRAPDPVTALHQAHQVARVGRRLARDVHDPLGTQPDQLRHRGRLAAGAGRVEDHRLEAAKPDSPEHLLDVAGEVFDSRGVDPRVEPAELHGVWVLLDRGHAGSFARRRHRDGADSRVEVDHALVGLGLQHVERHAIEDEHLAVIGLDKRVAARSKGQAPELERHRIVEEGGIREQLSDAMGELVARPARLAAVKAQAPQQAAALGLDGEQEVLQTRDLHLVGRLREGRQRPLDTRVMDEAAVDRQHRMRTHAMESEPPAAGAGHRLELTADAVAPWIVHAEHGGVGRQPKAGPSPRLLDDLALQGELVIVGRVLQLAASAGAEVGAWRGDAVRRRLEHLRGRGNRDAALASARLCLDDLARQRVADEPDLAVLSRNGGASVRRRRRPEDQRRQSETGSCAGLKPAASTIWVATLKPSATLPGSWASLPYWTAWPPTSRHQRTTLMSGLRVWPRVVLTSSTRPVRAAAARMARISIS